MILSRQAIVKARLDIVAAPLKAHLVPDRVLTFGMRLMAVGLKLVLASMPFSMVLSIFLGSDSPLIHLQFFVLGALGAVGFYMMLAGKIACLAAPAGRRLIALHLLSLLITVPLMLFEPDVWLFSVPLSGMVFLFFFHRLASHFRWSAILGRFRRVLLFYGFSLGCLASGSLLSLFSTDFGACGYLLAFLFCYLGLWVYASCLTKAYRALAVTAKPMSLGVLLCDLAKGYIRMIAYARYWYLERYKA